DINYTISDRFSGIIGGGFHDSCRFNLEPVWHERSLSTNSQAETIEADLAGVFLVKRVVRLGD
ncbi:MAG: hypothetical protein ACKO9T_04775, partial [Nitrospira sp.]